MKDTIPFLFCRYSLHIGEDRLDATATQQALNEIQGRFLPSGPTAEQRGEATIVVMKPEKLRVKKEDVVTWRIGHKPGHRTVTDYNASTQQMSYSIEKDRHILHSTVIALPRLGAMAVLDRTNALNMGARPALNRTRAAFRALDDAAFTYSFLRPGDLQAIVDKLDLKEYSYTVRRINPTPPSALAAALDASFAAEGIGIQSGVAKPMPGGTMKAEAGLIQSTMDLAGAGYGVLGFKGDTEAGHLAQIKKPPFSMDKKENLKQQEKEHPLRIFLEAAGDGEADLASVVSELLRFYSEEDGTPDIPQEPA